MLPQRYFFRLLLKWTRETFGSSHDYENINYKRVFSVYFVYVRLVRIHYDIDNYKNFHAAPVIILSLISHVIEKSLLGSDEIRKEYNKAECLLST